jgi:hypothetical protein
MKKELPAAIKELEAKAGPPEEEPASPGPRRMAR